MERKIIQIKNEQERAQVSAILIKNGYAVREITYMPAGTKTKRKALEFWVEE